MFVEPASASEAQKIQIVKGPNIKPFPIGKALQNSFNVGVALKVGDDITTDHIMPAGAKILPYRSNVAYLSKFCFEVIDADFSERAKKFENVMIIGGFNYGQGSSREHAALVPLYLGVKIVVAKSFARIHEANLINCGIIPLVFLDELDYAKIDLNDEFLVLDVPSALKLNRPIILKKVSTGKEIKLTYKFSDREKQIILAGGLLNYLKNSS